MELVDELRKTLLNREPGVFPLLESALCVSKLTLAQPIPGGERLVTC